MRFELDKEPAIRTLHYVSKSENWPIFLHVVKESARTSDFSDEQFQQCFSTLYNVFNNLKVEVISSRFEEEVVHSTESLTNSIHDDNLYELLGKRSGIMVLSDRVCVYNISNDFILLWTLQRNQRGTGTITWSPTDITYGGLISQSEENKEHNTLLLVLLFKEKAEVKTQEITSDSTDRKPTRAKSGSASNKTPFRVEQTDCSWFTTYYTDKQIPVRGFWRLQACGVRHSERKLIYVAPFVKNGYHRGAKMLNCA